MIQQSCTKAMLILLKNTLATFSLKKRMPALWTLMMPKVRNVTRTRVKKIMGPLWHILFALVLAVEIPCCKDGQQLDAEEKVGGAEGEDKRSCDFFLLLAHFSLNWELLSPLSIQTSYKCSSQLWPAFYNLLSSHYPLHFELAIFSLNPPLGWLSLCVAIAVRVFVCWSSKRKIIKKKERKNQHKDNHNWDDHAKDNCDNQNQYLLLFNVHFSIITLWEVERSPVSTFVCF